MVVFNFDDLRDLVISVPTYAFRELCGSHDLQFLLYSFQVTFYITKYYEHFFEFF